MKLKIGIITIGSLLWDNSNKRKCWRKAYLDATKNPIKIPIRYGRISSSRMDTYTMTYSKNLIIEEYGQGIVIGFKEPITTLEKLQEIADNVIRVERDRTKDEWKVIKSGEPFTLNWNWGVLGICVNPKHICEDKTNEDITHILEFWKRSLVNFEPSKFSIKKEPLMINKDGVFKIEWSENIEKYDFLISTIIQPDTKTDDGNYPNAEYIAKKMFEGNYYSYFINNVRNNIRTINDNEIKELIKSKFCISNYLKEMENKVST
jgi:hypothetical protein